MNWGKRNENILPKPYFFSGAFFLCLILVGIFFLNEIAFFNEGFPLTKMNDIEYLMTFLAFTVLFFAYWVFAKTRFRYREPVWLDLVILGILVFGIVGILLFPEETPIGEVVYVVTPKERSRDVLSFFASVALIYALFVIGPRASKGKAFSLLISWVLVLLAFIACIYSFIAEFDILSHFFRNDGSIVGHVAQSFCNNRNTFGTLLLFALGGLAVIHSHRPRFLYLPFVLLFALFLFFTLSKTSILLGVAFIGVYSIYRFVLTLPRHKIRNILALVFSLLAATFVLLLNFTSWFDWTGNLAAGTKNFFEALGKFGTFQTRIDSWEHCLASLDSPSKLWFGLGFRNINYYVYTLEFEAVGRTFPTHNGLIDVFCRSGIAGSILFAVLLLYFFVSLVLSIQKQNHLSVTYLLITAVFLCHSITETTDFFLMDAKAMALSLISLFPLLSIRYRDVSGIAEQEREFLIHSSPLPKVRYEVPSWRKIGLTLFWLSPFLFAFSCAGVSLGFHYSIDLLLNRGFYLSVILNFFLLPYAFYCLSFLQKKRGVYGFFLVLFASISLVVPIFLDGTLSLLISPLSLLMPIWIGSFSRNARKGKHPSLFWKSFAPYLLPLIASNLLCHLFDGAIATNHSRYLSLVLVFLGLFSLLFSLGLDTVHRHCLYPLKCMGERFEMRLSRILFAFSGKAKTARYYASIPPSLVKEEKERIKAIRMTKLR